MWYEKIERLNEYFKEINHARIKPGDRFNIHNECVKQQAAVRLLSPGNLK